MTQDPFTPDPDVEPLPFDDYPRAPSIFDAIFKVFEVFLTLGLIVFGLVVGGLMLLVAFG